MFIKEVKRKDKKYNKIYSYHRLVESVRTEKGPRQKNIIDLGCLKIDKSKWKALANRIEDILNGHTGLFEVDSQLEKLAKHYAS